MSGNLGGTYESFLTRCIEGARKEQEAFRELTKVVGQLEALKKRGHAAGLAKGWEDEGAGKLAAPMDAFKQEGNVYALLSVFKGLESRFEEKVKAAEAALAEEARRKEEEARRKEEEERRRREQQEKARRARAKAAKKLVRTVVLALVAALIWNHCTKETRMREKTAKVLGLGTVAGETKTLVLPGGATMEMVWCPPGTFVMGSPEGEAGRDSDETQHQVTLTKGFWLAKTEVTQSQWESVMGKNRSGNKGETLPVEKVSWKDCQKFCKKTGLSLPTEAEWEYACRAGSTGLFAAGGWCRADSGGATHPVGQKKPNEWGLYDMHGNVLEWCADWYGDYPSGVVTNPTGASSGSQRVLRGGGVYHDGVYCRSARRLRGDPSYRRGDDVGFRPASTLSE